MASDSPNVDKIVRLHGHKGEPGYSLMHPQNTFSGKLATAIYKRAGQAAVEPNYDKVFNYLSKNHGASVADALNAVLGPAEEKTRTIDIELKGKVIGQVPVGTKTYVLPSEVDNPQNKYFKTPDGSWRYASNHGTIEPAPTSYDKIVAEGHLVLLKEETGPGKSAAKTMDVEIKGKIVGQVPVGSKLYLVPEGHTDHKYFKAPDGSWYWTSPSGINHADSKSDKKLYDLAVAEGDLVPGEEEAPGPKVPVIIGGTKVAEAPSGSKIYRSKAALPNAASYIKTGDKWYQAAPSKAITGLDPNSKFVAALKKAIADGSIIDVTPGTAPSQHHHEVSPDAPTELKAHIGELEVTSTEIAQAISILKNAKGIMVKQPLTKHGNPLASMDYHAIAKGEKAAGFKGDTKPAVIQFLEKQLKNLAPSMAEKEVVKSEPEKKTGPALVTSVKELLKKPAPGPSAGVQAGTVKVGELEVTVAQVKQAIKTLQNSKGIMVKQPLDKAKSPLSSMDYHAIAQAEKAKGFQGNTKPAVIHHLEKLIQGKEEPETQKIDKGKIGTASAPTEPGIVIEGQTFQPGLYSSPGGNAHLRLEPSGKIFYVTHSGTEISINKDAFLANWGAGMTKYSPLPEPKAPEAPVAKKTPELGIKPGTYDIAGSQSKFKLFPDGSVYLNTPASGQFPLEPAQVSSFLKSGTLLDQYGNSVFVPGVKPDTLYFFRKNLSHDEAAKLQAKIPTGAKASELFEPEQLGLLFMMVNDHGFPATTAGYKQAAQSVLSILVHKAETKQTPNPETGSLKANLDAPGTPSGLFSFDENGYAVPFTGSLLIGYGTQSSSLTEKIKAVSAQFGDGKIVGQGLSQMTKQNKKDWLEAWAKGDMVKVFQMEGSKKPLLKHPGNPANAGTHSIVWGPAVAGELPAGVKIKGEWSSSPSAGEVDNYLIAAHMAHPEYLYPNEKTSWVAAHKIGNTAAVNNWSLKAKKRKDTGMPSYTATPVWTADLKPAKTYEAYAKSGKSPDYWPYDAVSDFYADNKLGEPTDPFAHKVKKILSFQDKKAAEELAESLKTKLEPDPAAPALLAGSTHPVQRVKDQHGNAWVFKTPPDKFVIEQEHAAHRLAGLWGYATAKSELLEYQGKYGQAQRLLDAEKDMKSFKGGQFNSLSASQLGDLAKEHLLDWALDNDDSHGANLLILKNGSIVGVDKGRSFVSYGHWNGLSGDHQADQRAQLIYTKMYEAIKGHEIDKEKADAAYASALKKARAMAKLPDSSMEAVLRAGFKNRTSWPPGSSEDHQVQLALARKNNLEADIQALWGAVYQDAHWELPEVDLTQEIDNKQGHRVHVGYTPELFEAVEKTKSHGTPVFFGGHDLEDSHLLLWHETHPTGGKQLRAETKVRGSKLQELTTWLAARAKAAEGEPSGQTGAKLLGEDSMYNDIIAGVKTISHHSEDGQYNEGKLAQLEKVKKALEATLAKADSASPSAFEGAFGVSREYGKQAAVHYLGLVEKAENLKKNGAKSQPGDFPKFEWVPPVEAPEDKPEPQIKITKRQAYREEASATAPFSPEGDLLLSGNTVPYGNGGYLYQVELPTGEKIEFRDEGKTSTDQASHGLLRFSVPEYGTGGEEAAAASLKRIHDQLETMGLPLESASDDDLELFYWRHLASVMGQRTDSKMEGTGFKKFWSALESGFKSRTETTGPIPSRDTTVKEQYGGSTKLQVLDTEGITAKLGPAEERELWRAAFGTMTSRDQVDAFVAGGGHLPQFGHFSPAAPELASGKPYWERFDVEDWTTLPMPGASLSDATDVSNILDKGYLSTEARLRALAKWKSGMSSGSDQAVGSSSFVFTRLTGEGSNDYSIYFSPKVLLRTSNYSYSGDNYGDTGYRHQLAPFAMDKVMKFRGNSGNETMIKDAMSALDDIEIVKFHDPAARQKALDKFAKLGITEIRGVPLTIRFVNASYSNQDLKKAREAVKASWAKQK